MTFGAWLKREIEERLLSQEAFAAKAGIPLKTLTDWLAPNRPPRRIRAVNIVRLSRALGVPREQIESRLRASTDTASTASQGAAA